MFTTCELFGKFHSPKAPLRKAREGLGSAPPQELEQLFGSFFPAGLLSQADEGPNSRNRVFPVRVTFWAFLWQALNPGSSCRDGLLKIISWFSLLGRPKPKEDTSPYCTARGRLEVDTLERALRASAQAAEQRAPHRWLFHDREVIVGDGTTNSAPDTKATQRAFPQSKRQQPGCGFPLVKWVALFSMRSGALLEVVLGNKHKAELKLFRKLWDALKEGMIFLADRGFCDYVTVAGLWLRKVDSVLRLNAMRPHDFRHGKRLGRYDRLVIWDKPERKPRTATRKLWRSLPDQITLRLIRYPVLIAGFRPRHIILVTTLLDPALYPASEMAELYRRRWRVELFLRHIKTTLGLDQLTCKTPDMLYKELLMRLIAYNLIRCLMVESASIHDVALERISFKGTASTLRQFSKVIAETKSRRHRARLINDMLECLARDLLPDRPNRVEPRNTKRRRKAYPVLTKPRAEMKAKLMRGKNLKKRRS